MKPQVNEEREYLFNIHGFAQTLHMLYWADTPKSFDVCDATHGYILKVEFHELTDGCEVLMIGGYGLPIRGLDLSGYNYHETEFEIEEFLKFVFGKIESTGVIVSKKIVDA